MQLQSNVNHFATNKRWIIKINCWISAENAILRYSSGVIARQSRGEKIDSPSRRTSSLPFSLSRRRERTTIFTRVVDGHRAYDVGMIASSSAVAHRKLRRGAPLQTGERELAGSRTHRRHTCPSSREECHRTMKNFIAHGGHCSRSPPTKAP